MQNHQLREILNALTPAEQRRLEQFLASPYHVTHADVPRLYAALRQLDKTKVVWAPEAVFAAAFPGRAFDAGALHHRASWLFKAVEAFLALENWQSDPDNPALALQRAYNDRRLTAPFRHARVLRERVRAKVGQRPAERLRADYALAWEQYRHETAVDARAEAGGLAEAARALDAAFVAEKLRLACLSLSWRTVGAKADARSADSADLLLPAVLAAVAADDALLAEPAVAVYYYAYRALSGGEAPQGGEAPSNSPQGGGGHFAALKAVLTTQATVFPEYERRVLFLLAINFCIRRINAGDHGYFREVFDLYRAGLDSGALLEGGWLSRFTFKNIVVTGLRLGEHAWVRRFIDDYAAYLDPAQRAATVHFNLGIYYYESGQHAEAQRHLGQRAYDDPLHNMAARVLLAKIYYRSGEWDALDSLLDALDLYARRQKQLGYHRANFRNFVKAMRQLLQATGKARAGLRAAWEAMEPLTEREWLVGQL